MPARSRSTAVSLAPLCRLVLLALLASLASGCLTDDRLKAPFAIDPIRRPHDWPISTAEDAGFDRKRLEQAYRPLFSEDEFPTAISLLVIRHGALVAEGYMRDPDDIDTLVQIKSATKSVTSVLLGIAIDRGLVDADLDRTVASYLPDHFGDHSRYAKVTLLQALTMRTGIDFDNDVHTNVLRGDDDADSVDYVLARPPKFAPGERFDYHDGNPHLIGAVIANRSHMSLDGFAERFLFEPLGIERHHWDKHHDGLQYGAFGLYLRARDFARLGQMLLDQGTFDGERVVSSEWLERATQAAVPDSEPWPYGYYFWIDPKGAGFTAQGHGGQYLYVEPALDLLVVLTAEPTVTGDEVGIPFSGFERLRARLREAIIE